MEDDGCQTALPVRRQPETPTAAVESIVGLFESFARHEAAFQLGDEIVANLSAFEDLAETWLLGNRQAVQQQNGLAQQKSLDFIVDPEIWAV